MPNLPKKPCPKCKQLYSGAQCPNCKPVMKARQRYDAKRVSRSQAGYSRRWYRYRASVLKKNAVRHGRSHPVCEACNRVIYNHSHAHLDHIKPHKGDTKLFWDKNNHQILCIGCHSEKTRRGE